MKYKVQPLPVIFASSCLFLILKSAAADGSYMGLWAKDKEACSGITNPNRTLLEQTDLLTPGLHCKFLGLRQNDSSGMTFMANCEGEGVKWHEEVTVRESENRLSLKLKSDGQEKTYVRCVTETEPPKGKQKPANENHQ